jgi:transcriptional regulator with XRE-family HTH domain
MSLQQHVLAGLKPLRLARNLTRDDMAAAIGVTATSYDRFENGTRRLYFDKACALADRLSCSLDELRHDPGAGSTDTVVIAGEGALAFGTGETSGAEEQLRDWEL